MNVMKVRNMRSSRGNKIANQFIIEDIMLDSGKPVTYFQSYNSIIVRIEGSAVVLDCNKWDYSPTTSKYRNIFLGETTKKTRAKIKSGKYVLSDLN